MNQRKLCKITKLLVVRLRKRRVERVTVFIKIIDLSSGGLLTSTLIQPGSGENLNRWGPLGFHLH